MVTKCREREGRDKAEKIGLWGGNSSGEGATLKK